MLQFENRTQLLQDGELLPVVEELVSCLAEGQPLRTIHRVTRCFASSPGWVVFKDDAERGFAINAEGLVTSRTSLRLRMNSLVHAKRIIQRFGGRDAFPCRLTDYPECPVGWSLYQLVVSPGTVLCAVSSPPPVLGIKEEKLDRRFSRIRLPFIGYLPATGTVSVGERWALRSIPVECPDQRFRGDLFIGEGGAMSVQTHETADFYEEGGDSGASSMSALVRLDIGEIELALSEVAALRSGSRLELKAELPIRCFMRVGATTIAQGELQVDGADLIVRVTEVIG